MKKLISIILILAALFASAGCTYKVIEKPGLVFTTTKPVMDGISTFPPAMSGDDMMRGGMLGWDEVRTGSTSPGERKIYPSYEAFAAEYGENAKNIGTRGVLKELDESRKVFIVRVGFTVNTGGYSFSVANAYVRDGEAVIEVNKEAPSPDMNVTQAFVTHELFVVFNAADYKEDMKVIVKVNGSLYDFPGFGDEI